MAERAGTQRVEPIVRLGRRQEKRLDNVEQFGTEVPRPIRGANDAEGHLFIDGNALDSYPEAASAAPINVEFPIEGEEHVSTLGLVPFTENNLSWLKADVCAISDSSMWTMEQPPMTHRLRRKAQIQVEVLEPKDDLHSGFWRGATHNPALALVEMLSTLCKPDNTVAVPGFYEDVVSLTPDERTMIAKSTRNETVIPDLPEMQPRGAHTRKRGTRASFHGC
jgi:acetylornithine deacetylase/succinyl-diaminopimelate desuccinylase-like protein